MWRPQELLRDLALATGPVTGHTAAEVSAELQAARWRVIAERCNIARLCSLQAGRMFGWTTNSKRTTFVRSRFIDETRSGTSSA